MSGVHILGAGAIPWGKQPVMTQLQMALEAINAALRDAELNWNDVDGVVAASSRFEGGMGWGLHANEIVQAASERGVPCINVGGACAAGAIAFQTAFSMLASGQSQTVVVIGAERMPKGFIPRPPGGADDITDNDFLRWVTMGLTIPAYWAMEAQRRIYDYKTTHESLAEAVMLMRRNAVHNPNARFRKSVTAAEVLASPMVTDPLHLLQICPVSDGAAALILCSEKVAARAARKSVEVAGVGIASGTYGDPAHRIPTVGGSVKSGVPHTSEVMSAAEKAMAMAGVEHDDVDVLEMADNTAWHLLAWPEMLGFVEPGQGDWMLQNHKYDVDGELALNPSGGFLSFGEATTAQAVLQICELVWQLRGEAVGRQVLNARVGMSAVLGLGANGGSVVLKR